MQTPWTTDPETGRENSSIPFKEIHKGIMKVLRIQIPNLPEKELFPVSWIILTNLAAEYKMVPIDLLEDDPSEPTTS